MTAGQATPDGRIAQLMALRVVMVTTLMVAAVYVETAGQLLPGRGPLYALIAGTYGATIVYAVALKLGAPRQALVFAQIVGDLLLITGLVYLTGASRVGFQLLYPISTLSGGVFLYRRGGLAVAAIATALYGGLLAAARSGWVPPRGLADLEDLSGRAVIYSVFVTGVACVTVAWVGSYLAQSLRQVGRQLEQATEEMADLRELTEIVVESIQSGLMTADAQGRIEFVNPQGATMLGRTAGGLVGSFLDTVFESPALQAAALDLRASERRFSRMNATCRHSDGTLLDIGLSLSPLARGRGGYLVVFQDLTDVRRLEREVQAKERLAAAGELAAQLAHEIRNPLGSISGAAQMLMNDGDVSEDRQRLLSIIRRESQRLAASLEQFLGQARATARPSGPIDLGGVFDRAVTLLRTGLSQERHTVTFERDQGPHVCIADPDAMTQVFWNLARNGLEAMPSGGTLAISLRRDREDVVLRVRDDGRGLAERDARLFEPFVSRSPMGTGLGLAIVYRIVQSHGGDIVLRNRPGQGTEAEVRLPAARAAQDERAGAHSAG